MKNSIKFGIVAIAFTSFANGQWLSGDKIKGDGNVVTKEITTSSYDKVIVSGFYDVDLISGAEGKITVKGEENLLNYLKIEVVDGALKIGTEKGKYLSTTRGYKIIITVPFESLDEVSLSGSGDVNLTISAKEVIAKVTGSGDMVLKGKTTDFKGDVTGSGDLTAYELESDNANASVVGSGDCKVFCRESLIARVNGSGDIDYKGDPKKKDTKTNGSGSISKS
jgi:Putative auto-transporter adhesin, head GIN domain